ncbi:MAG: ABC transporter permease [Bacilli bacterium]|nr:ABC transporter permease [Bacilli bacterium]
MSTKASAFTTLRLRHRKFDKSFFYSWEMILIYLFVFINILLMSALPDIYFSSGSIQTIIRSGMDLSIMVLGMTFILILGEIDVSAASIMLVSAMVIGLSCGAGVPEPIAVILGIIAGGACGLINGLLVSLLNMPSVIVTIATSMLFRGLVRVVLKDSYLNTFPDFFVNLAWDDLGGVIPISMIVFLCLAVIFGIVLHRSKFGRQLYIIGNSKDVAKYSGIKSNKIRIIAFVIMGVTAALSSMIFVGRLDGITFSMGTGYELKVIAIAVLGGVSTLGGKGKIYGPVIATFIMAFLTKSLDLFEVHPNVQKIAIGVILVLAVLIPRLNKETFKKIRNKFKIREIRRLESADVPYNIEKARQAVIGTRMHRMNEKEFILFVRNIQLTSEKLDFDGIYPKYNKAKTDYKHYKAYVKKLNKHDSNYQKAQETLAKKKALYIELYRMYKLCIDIYRLSVKTNAQLIKLNTKCVMNEITDSINRHYEGYQYKYASIPDYETYRKNLRFTTWDIRNNITYNKIRQLRNKAIVSTLNANYLYLITHLKYATKLTAKRDYDRFYYLFNKEQVRIAKYYNKQIKLFDKSMTKLKEKIERGELKHEEK